MPHITLPEGLPGISAGFAFRPETAKPMRELAHILLHEPNSLAPGERELIASHCYASHAAVASAHLGDASIVEKVRADVSTAPISRRMKALLVIAGKVQQDGKLVTADDVEAAHKQGATDIEIHDTVLIAAAFSMYNRYVDGLGAWQPENPEMYTQMGQVLAENGYLQPSMQAPSLPGK